MKVMLVNGSPHKNGCTHRALMEIAAMLQSENIEVSEYWIGNKTVNGCIGCFRCSRLQKCVFDDEVNQFVQTAGGYDGFIFGSPVYFAGMNGSLLNFMTRVFFSAGSAQKDPFLFKPAAAVVSARRAGTTAALEEMNKFFLHHQMPVVSSRYWNMVHGMTPDEVEEDLEGLQTMRVLGRNMAWMLKLINAGKDLGIPLPEQEPKRISTNFVR